MPTPTLIRKLSRQGWGRIAAAICWERTDESVVHYEEWPAQKKEDLAQALGRILAGQTLGLPAAPALSVNFASTATAETCLSPALPGGTSSGTSPSRSPSSTSWMRMRTRRGRSRRFRGTRSRSCSTAGRYSSGIRSFRPTPSTPAVTLGRPPPVTRSGLSGFFGTADCWAARSAARSTACSPVPRYLVHYGGNDDIANVVDHGSSRNAAD